MFRRSRPIPHSRRLIVQQRASLSSGPEDVILAIQTYMKSRQAGGKSYKELFRLSQGSTDKTFRGRQAFITRHEALLRQVKTTQVQLSAISLPADFYQDNLDGFKFTASLLLSGLRGEFWLGTLMGTLAIEDNKRTLTEALIEFIQNIREKILLVLQDLDDMDYPVAPGTDGTHVGA